MCVGGRFWYAVEQYVFLYEWNVECGFTRKCGIRCYCKFPRIRVSSVSGIHKLTVRSTGGSLLDKESAKDVVCLLKRQNGWVRTHTTEITEIPCTGNWHFRMSSSQNKRAVNFSFCKRYIERERECVCACVHAETSFSPSLIIQISLFCCFYGMMFDSCGKSCSILWWVIQFLLVAIKWQLCVTMSVNALY
jgi:hypothetical protein